MALKEKTRQMLMAVKQYDRGVIRQDWIKALFAVMQQVKEGLYGNPPDVKVIALTTVGSTAQIAYPGPCRFYGIRVESPASGSTLKVAVKVLDDTVQIGPGNECDSGKVSEAYFAAGADGCGVPIASSLQIKAFAYADGTSDPAAGDKPTVKVYYGVA
jgi:hypothetical protein